MKTLLSLKNVSLNFGGIIALSKITFDFFPGEILGLIGPNGAGKTSAFNVISGIYKPTSGEVLIEGQPITAKLNCKIKLIVAAITAAGFIIGSFIFNIQEIWKHLIVESFEYGSGYNFNIIGEQLNKIYPLFFSSNSCLFALLFTLLFFGTTISILNSRISGPESAAKLGVSRTFQNIRLYPKLTALQNVLVGYDLKLSSSAISNLFKLKKTRRDETIANNQAIKSLELVGLGDKRSTIAEHLSYGDQRRLEIARALVRNPKILLLDEPAAGLNPAESIEITNLIKKISNSGVGIVLIEHDMSVIMNCAERIIVLNHGELLASGTPEQIKNNKDVIKAYLG